MVDEDIEGQMEMQNSGLCTSEEDKETEYYVRGDDEVDDRSQQLGDSMLNIKNMQVKEKTITQYNEEQLQ